VSHVTDSILTSVKKVLGLDESYTAFDLDVLMHINTVFSVLTQIGIGPTDGYMIEDATPTWDAFIGTDNRLNAVKTYVYLRVRVLFDPPTTSFVADAMEKQIKELEWRLNVVREGDSWTDPNPPAPVPTEPIWWGVY
jgi:hypothetical protein